MKRWHSVVTIMMAVVGLCLVMGCKQSSSELSSNSTADAGSGQCRIVGTVKCSDGNPIKGAKVLLMGAGIGTVTTTSDGEFRIDNIAPGTYNLEVTHPDYEDYMTTITVDINAQPTVVTVTMTPKP